MTAEAEIEALKVQEVRMVVLEGPRLVYPTPSYTILHHRHKDRDRVAL